MLAKQSKVQNQNSPRKSPLIDEGKNRQFNRSLDKRKHSTSPNKSGKDQLIMNKSHRVKKKLSKSICLEQNENLNDLKKS